MANYSPVDYAQIVTAGFTAITGLAAVAAVVVAALQGKATAQVNRKTLAGLREERERRAEDAAYDRWLNGRLAERQTIPNVARGDLPPEEERFIERAIREGFLIPSRERSGAFFWVVPGRQ